MAPSSFSTCRGWFGVLLPERKETAPRRAARITAMRGLPAARGARNRLVPAARPPWLVRANRPGRPPAVSRMTLLVRLLLPTLRLLTLWTLTRMQRPAARPLLPPRSANGRLRRRTRRSAIAVPPTPEPRSPRRRRGASGCQRFQGIPSRKCLRLAYQLPRLSFAHALSTLVLPGRSWARNLVTCRPRRRARGRLMTTRGLAPARWRRPLRLTRRRRQPAEMSERARA